MLQSCSHGAGQADQQSWVNLCWLQLQEASLGLLQDPAQGSIVVVPHLGQIGVEQGDGCVCNQPGLFGCQGKLLSRQKCLQHTLSISEAKVGSEHGPCSTSGLKRNCAVLDCQSVIKTGLRCIMCNASGSRCTEQVRRQFEVHLRSH